MAASPASPPFRGQIPERRRVVEATPEALTLYMVSGGTVVRIFGKADSLTAEQAIAVAGLLIA
jgi:hypothetical protein